VLGVRGSSNWSKCGLTDRSKYKMLFGTIFEVVALAEIVKVVALEVIDEVVPSSVSDEPTRTWPLPPVTLKTPFAACRSMINPFVSELLRRVAALTVSFCNRREPEKTSRVFELVVILWFVASITIRFVPPTSANVTVDDDVSVIAAVPEVTDMGVFVLVTNTLPDPDVVDKLNRSPTNSDPVDKYTLRDASVETTRFCPGCASTYEDCRCPLLVIFTRLELSRIELPALNCTSPDALDTITDLAPDD
jgi:hypothetical protein